MNAILGGRIKQLRESKKLTIEYVAEKLGCTRQRYARLEKGQSDISYSMLCAISDILGVNVNTITEVFDLSKPLASLFRVGDNSQNIEKSCDFLMEMLDTFYAHKKIYNGIRSVD